MTQPESTTTSATGVDGRKVVGVFCVPSPGSFMQVFAMCHSNFEGADVRLNVWALPSRSCCAKIRTDAFT